MKKFAAILALFMGMAILCSRVLPVYAAEEAAPAAAEGDKSKDAKGEEGTEAPKDGAKAEGGKPEGGSKKKNGDVTGGRFAGDPVYVRIMPMTLPIINEAGVEQLVTIQMTVEVKDIDVAEDMHTNMPRVLDALNRVLYGGLGDGSIENGRLVDVTKIKAKVLTVLKDTVGSDNIKDVLVVNVSQRML